MKKNNKSKVAVIGGSGFLGKATANELTRRGYNVVILDKIKSENLLTKQTYKFLDVMNRPSIEKALKNVDYVYNFAGIADIQAAKDKPRNTIENNIIGNVEIIESCIKNRVKRVIFASTMYVYGDLGSFYRASKQCSEILLKTYAENSKLNFTILRYGSLYGPDAQPWNGISKYINEIISTGKIKYHGSGNEMREYIHIEDAARLSVDMIDKNITEKAVNITGNQVLKSIDLLKMIFEIAGIKENIKFSKKTRTSDHYKMTPYKFEPEQAYKILPDRYIDLGQGIHDIIKKINND